MNTGTGWIARRLTLVAGLLVTGALAVSSEASADLRELCENRCRMNKVICTDSSIPLGGGSGSATRCQRGCVDDYIDCGAVCLETDPHPSCALACSGEMSSCANQCRPAAPSTAACNDAYVGCRNSCSAAPRCTNNAHCDGKVCQDGQCNPPCTNDTWCRRRIGPDAICMRSGPDRGKCLKT
jgi:hypothetical protein